ASQRNNSSTKQVTTDTPGAADQQAEANGYFIVQYRGAIQSTWAAELQTRGIEITGYLPNTAYIVKSSADQIAQPPSTVSVRWIGAYGAGLKVAPELVEVSSASPNASTTALPPEGGATNLIHVSLVSFKGGDAGALRETIGQLAPEPIIEERGDGRVWAALA